MKVHSPLEFDGFGQISAASVLQLVGNGGAQLAGSGATLVQGAPLTIQGNGAAMSVICNTSFGAINLQGFARCCGSDATRTDTNVGFYKRVSFAATGAPGTLIDVPVWPSGVGNTVPFTLRLLMGDLRVFTALAGGAATLRTATAGGGAVVLPDDATPTQTFSVATKGRKSDNAAATVQLANATQLYLRVDRSVAGELILSCERS